MLDYVIAGSNGFIGRSLTTQLRGAGYLVATDREFRNETSAARVFINCANIAHSPSAALRLLREKIAMARGRVETFVQVQSFSTLHGSGEIALHKFNCGFRPTFLNFYGAGKLEQERALIGEPKTSLPHIWLIYLPVVLGEGSGWSAALERAKAYGYRLPSHMSAAARANWIFVEDLGHVLVRNHTQAMRAQVARTIVNRPESESSTWDEFLSGGKGTTPENRELVTAKSCLRNSVLVLLMFGIGLAYGMRILLWTERLLRKMRPIAPLPATKGLPPPAVAEPLVLGGLSRRLAQIQPYLPGWSQSDRLVVNSPGEGGALRTKR